MSVLGGTLFFKTNGASLSDVLRHNLEREVPNKVDQIPVSGFEKYTDDQLTERIVEKCGSEPLILKTEDAQGGAEPIKMNVRGHFGESVTVPGLRVTQSIPFEGEAQLFSLRPNSYSYNPPYGQVSGKNLIIGMEVRDGQEEEAIQHIASTRAAVQEWINKQASELEQHDKSLPAIAMAAIQRRRATLSKAADIASRLSGS